MNTPMRAVRINEALWERVQHTAKTDNVTASEAVRILLTVALNAKPEEQEDGISWGELALLTHKTQVEKFNFCSCEDNEGRENPYEDCPTEPATGLDAAPTGATEPATV